MQQFRGFSSSIAEAPLARPMNKLTKNSGGASLMRGKFLCGARAGKTSTYPRLLTAAYRRNFSGAPRTSSIARAGMFSSAMAYFSGSAGAAKTEGKDFLMENQAREGVVSLPSGLQYKVLRQGKGTAHPTKSTPCDCHYEGKLLSGKKFDSSYDRGSPTTFAPNQVIPGWTEAMQLMVEGDLWELYIPSELAYGDSGVGGGLIPGGATLVFKMEIVRIKGPSVAKK